MSAKRDAFIDELVALARDLQARVMLGRSDADEAEWRGLEVTIGADGTGWAYQTGDNSFFGPAYHFSPNWGVATLFADTHPIEFAQEILFSLEESRCDDGMKFFYELGA